jgi:hypothetical protein
MEVSGVNKPEPGTITADEPWVKLVANLCRRPALFTRQESFRLGVAFLTGVDVGCAYLDPDRRAAEGLSNFLEWVRQTLMVRLDDPDQCYPWDVYVVRATDPAAWGYGEPRDVMGAFHQLLALLSEYLGIPEESLDQPMYDEPSSGP